MTAPELHPEQVQALEYARRAGTEAPAESIRRRLAETCSQLDALLESLPEELVQRRPAPGRWSVQEVVDHLVESHRPAADQLAALLAGRSPEGGPVPAGLLSPAPLEASWGDVRRRLGEVHGRLVGLLEGASEATPLDARAPVEMVVKCSLPGGGVEPVHWVERFDWKAFAILLRAHVREHVEQVRAIVDAIAPQPAPDGAGAPTAGG